MQARIAASRLRQQPPDYLISISLPDVGLFDFHRCAEAVAAGRAAARAALAELRIALASAVPLYQRLTRWLDAVAERPRLLSPPNSRPSGPDSAALVKSRPEHGGSLAER